MAAVAPLELARPAGEQRMLLHGVSWKEYVVLRELLDGPGREDTPQALREYEEAIRG